MSWRSNGINITEFYRRSWILRNLYYVILSISFEMWQNVDYMLGSCVHISFTFCNVMFSQLQLTRHAARGEGGGGEDVPPAWLKQVRFAMNRKHAIFWCYSLNYRPEKFFVSSFLCRKMYCLVLSCLVLSRTVLYHNIAFDFRKRPN